MSPAIPLSVRLIAPALSPADRALLVASAAHEGQFDKGGEPYIAHPIAVASRFKRDSDECVVGLLHDVIEDTEVTLDDLRDLGFNDTVINAVDAISRRKGEGDLSYLARIVENPVAVKVKVSDATHNSDPDRLEAIENLGVRDRLQAKYANILTLLKPALDALTDGPTIAAINSEPAPKPEVMRLERISHDPDRCNAGTYKGSSNPHGPGGFNRCVRSIAHDGDHVDEWGHLWEDGQPTRARRMSQSDVKALAAREGRRGA